jgi:hypothetical protein
MAKAGDPQARAWLGQYLVGRAATAAPSVLAVTVQQWQGTDPVVSKIAKSIEHEQRFDIGPDRGLIAAIQAEIASKISNVPDAAPVQGAGRDDNVIGVDFQG